MGYILVMYAVPIDDMRSVTESRNRVGSGNSKEKWLWNGASVAHPWKIKVFDEMNWAALQGQGQNDFIVVTRVKCGWTVRWLFLELAVETPALIEGVGELKVVLRPVCSRHGIGVSTVFYESSPCFYDNAARWNARSFLGNMSGVLSRNIALDTIDV